jgi:DNA-binding MarR family transcriptional regulator
MGAEKKCCSKNEKYLSMAFTMLKMREGLSLCDKETHFNNTELRLIGEVISAKYEGKRLISTQIAKTLGVTRSAISQIVNRLEAENVVKRVADDVDRKIAYIEVTDSTMETYKADMKTCLDFLGRVVDKFGEENFEKLYELFNTFLQLLENEKQALH